MNIKTCCTKFYESDLTRMVIGSSFHPGGLGLTKRLCDLINLEKNEKVLDIACGNGTSAIYIAKEFKCAITGVDLSKENIRNAREKAKKEKLNNVNFVIRDSENLKFKDEFDAIISECSFCTFPNKDKAVKEMFKALNKNGRIGISDVIVDKVPKKMKNMLYKVLCVADAKNVKSYKTIFERNGFANFSYEDHKDSFEKMLRRIKKRIFALELLFNLETNKKLNFKGSKKIIKNIQLLVRKGNMSYGLITAKKYK